MNFDERRWVQRYLNGDASGFDAIYDANCDRIYRLCYRLSGSKSDAEDLTQEVFIAASRGLQNFQHRASLSTWLYRIALDCWRAQMRKKRVEQVSTQEDRLFADTVLGELNILDRIVLERAIEHLHEDLRQALILVKSEGLKYREAAVVLGVPQGTIQFRVHEAIMRIRAYEERSRGTAPNIADAQEIDRNAV